MTKKTTVKLDLPTNFEDGVYFDLPDSEYHSEPRLSATGMKWLTTGEPMDFWARSWMNPRFVNEDTPSRILGRAYHARILEGREAYHARFAPALDKADYPNALFTVADLKNFLAAKGETVSNASSKSKLINLVQQFDEHPVIWDVVKQAHAEKCANKTLLQRDVFDNVEYAATIVDHHPTAHKVVSGGYAEVSVFYSITVDEIDGSNMRYKIPLKARFDYLKSKAICDLKSYSNHGGLEIMKAIYKAIASYKYHIQVASYLQAWDAARFLIQDSQITGTAKQRIFLQEAAKHDKAFWFLFQQSGAAPSPRVCEFPIPSMAFDSAKVIIEHAQIQFARNYEFHGSEPWIADSCVERLDDNEFPVWMF